MSENNVVSSYRVEVEDKWLDIHNFQTVRADSEDHAIEIFNENYGRADNTQKITNVEEIYSIDLEKLDNLFGLDSLNNFS